MNQKMSVWMERRTKNHFSYLTFSVICSVCVSCPPLYMYVQINVARK